MQVDLKKSKEMYFHSEFLKIHTTAFCVKVQKEIKNKLEVKFNWIETAKKGTQVMGEVINQNT